VPELIAAIDEFILVNKQESKTICLDQKGRRHLGKDQAL